MKVGGIVGWVFGEGFGDKIGRGIGCRLVIDVFGGVGIDFGAGISIGVGGVVVSGNDEDIE